MAITAPTRSEPVVSGDGQDAGRAADPFLRWGLATYLIAVVVMVAAVVVWLGGRFVYVLDDPAIHLSMADRLAHDGTWGVTAGDFQSASSSPLWTALLAAVLLVAGPLAEWVPLLLNVAAGVAVVWLLAQAPAAVSPARRRPLDAAATVVLVAVVLFLPGLALVGMEHTLHVALVLAAVLGVDRLVRGEPGVRPGLVYAAVALATLARFETAFVAAGIAAALLVADRAGTAADRAAEPGAGDASETGPDAGDAPGSDDGRPGLDRRTRRVRAVGVLAAAALPIAAFGVVNKAMGGAWLPNSVLAKGQATDHTAGGGTGPVDVVNRLTHDPLLAAFFALAVGYLLVRGTRGRAAVPAVILAVAAPLHAALADVGWYERYQAYLLAVGAYLLLAVLSEVPAPVRRRALVLVCVLGLVFGTVKTSLLVRAPLAADDMYRHQYQAGRFLDRYYDGEPVATDQLGYISYLHRGPITDFAGLGDHDVLDAPAGDGIDEQWARLHAERGFRVVVLYDVSAAFNVPAGWVRAGEWVSDGEPVSGVSSTLQFFATTTDEIEPLQEHLREFEDELPARTHLVLNEQAGLQGLAIDNA